MASESNKPELIAGYQTAMDLLYSESEMLWSKFNAFLLVNSIIFGSLIILISNSIEHKTLAIVISLIGITLSIFWFFLIKRGFDYVRYWTTSAREIEQYLDKKIQIFSRGKNFSKGETVSLKIEGKLEKIQMSCLSKLKAEKVSYAVIVIFIILYIAALIIT